MWTYDECKHYVQQTRTITNLRNLKSNDDSYVGQMELPEVTD